MQDPALIPLLVPGIGVWGVGLEGFGLGLSIGAYCMAACGPLMLPFMFAEGKKTWSANLWMVLEFLAGRLIAYVGFALLVSYAGAACSGPGYGAGASIGMLVCGSLMLLYAFMRHLPRFEWCSKALRSSWVSRFPFVLGLVAGFNVCPPFVAGMFRLFALGSPLFGVAYFTAFFIATSLYILPLALAAPLARFEWLKKVGAVACGLSGLWLVWLGASGLLSA